METPTQESFPLEPFPTFKQLFTAPENPAFLRVPFPLPLNAKSFAKKMKIQLVFDKRFMHLSKNIQFPNLLMIKMYAD